MSEVLEIFLNVVCIIGIIILVFSFTFKVSNFLNIKGIFQEHFRIFNGNYLQLLSLYILPVFIALKIALNYQITKDTLESVNLIITILTSMFFAIISILCAVNFEQKKEKYKKLVGATFNSTLFEIICCLILLLISFIVIFRNNYEENCTLTILSTLIYYFLIVIILNVFLILKRIKAVFEKNMMD